ncbi:MULTISPECIES: 8-amino-7-oxononanoate synthase [unclassified Variovorax]|uniref:8-amino-7-oxononanoate synthase n=1 Tax=unclassified Variovorax TaxID=663243 RepID=UPI00076DA56E|nr:MULTISPECIES: 8-amino-7-oxononanoate synthase [unclassified Variovorax]KWT69742.1 8-amino-7-oxononanoate synthase [Variovorax sp. WDL1]PNG53352.1 8-amino-7-oxononanoate synthase [Variovorax sp. B2]PNG53924.1 8-amino-7-oxononanoate synthase [Variovorax sp. B4]VTV11391.1 8-amino-7-oxononanoate synthase [Variovorax sp. WDL1]
MSRLLDRLQHEIATLDAQTLRRRRLIAETPCAPEQQLTLAGAAAPRTVLAFGSNDYLGLAAHPVLAAALAEGAARYGAGSGGSHLILGHSRAHAQLEERLAGWMAPHIPEAQSLFFCTGYMANLAVLSALGGAEAVIFSETLNHASLIDGARLAKARVERYPHCDVQALDAQLGACEAPVKLIVSDAVFSMDGNIAPVAELLALAERHDAWLVLDDAHGFGVLGARGRGVLEEMGLRSERIILVGTLGKAAGVAGAFVAAHRTVIDYLVQRARPYIFTTAAPPAMAHALLASLDLIEGEEGNRRRAQLRARIAQLRAGLQRVLPAGGMARLAESSTAIQPLIVGDNARAMQLSAQLDAFGLRVGAIRPPTVPVGTARLRIALSASHGESDVARLVDALGRLVAQPWKEAA